MQRALDSSATRVVVHTFAEGMFAKLAKDLEIEFPATGSVTIEEAESRAEISFALDRVRVVGVRKNEKTDEGALSSSDRSDIVEKFRHAIGARSSDRITVVARVATDENVATIDVAIPCGKTSVKRACEITRADDAARVTGECDLSMSALGVQPVKGPMGAFRLSDRLRVRFDVSFR